MRRAVTFLAVVGIWLAVGVSGAWATISVTLDAAEVELEKADDGSYSTAVGVSNISGSAQTVDFSVASGSCSLVDDSATVAPASEATIPLTFREGCSPSGDTIGLTAAVEGQAQLAITAKQKSDAAPDWNELRVFTIAFVGLIFLGFVLLGVWSPLGWKDLDEGLAVATGWSFKDSWASSVTLGVGLVTGIFGSGEVLKALLGKDADQAMALATIGSAIAAAFVAAGPLVLQTIRPKATAALPVWGLLTASTLTLTGAFGEIWIVTRSAQKLDFGVDPDLLWVPMAFVMLLLLAYAVSTLRAAITEGRKAAAATPLSETLAAAVLVASVQAGAAEIPPADFRQLVERVAKALEPEPAGAGVAEVAVTERFLAPPDDRQLITAVL